VPYAFEKKRFISKSSISLNKLVLLTCLLVILYFGYERYASDKTEQIEASIFISTPQRNDIYFLDLRLLSDKLDIKNKYKLAKIVRVNNDNVAIVYGKFSYQWQSAVVNSIEYGDLSNKDYFTLMPDYIPFSKIKKMWDNGAIYLIKRPVRNKLYGHFVSP